MTRPPPPLTLIRAFEAAARHLSFTRAAQDLGYTQAAISGQVRALEAYVGRDLFLRRARSLQLTEAGSAFLPTLREALAQIDAATAAIASGGRDRAVLLACPVSLAENWLPAAIAAFQARHPEAEITVHATVWDGAEDPGADLEITVSRKDEVPADARPLWPETLSLLCAPQLAATLADPAAALALPRILIAGRQEYWPLMAQAAGLAPAAAAGPGPRVLCRTNSTNVALELAAQGRGATIAVTALAALYLRRGLLAEPLALRPPSPWAYYIRNRGLRRSAMADRLCAHLQGLGPAGPV